jgi:hypothetical protein
MARDVDADDGMTSYVVPSLYRTSSSYNEDFGVVLPYTPQVC